MEQVNKYFTQKENKKNVLDFLIQSTPLLQLSTYLLTYLLHGAESFLRGLYAPVITTICFISLLINRYNDRLLPLLRQFFLIPNRINKLMDLKVNCLRQPTLPLSIRINTGSLYRNVSTLNYKRDKDNVS